MLNQVHEAFGLRHDAGVPAETVLWPLPRKAVGSGKQGAKGAKAGPKAHKAVRSKGGHKPKKPGVFPKWTGWD